MAAAPAGLTIQQLSHGHQRVLVLSQLAGARGGGWFRPSDVVDLFEAFRLPPPGNVSEDLARLRRSGLLTKRTTRPSWSVTPLGDEEVRKLVGELESADIPAPSATDPGADLGQGRHTLLPPAIAPVRWQAAIERMLAEHPFDRNVFCMTRFPEEPGDATYLDPVANVIPVAQECLARHGLTLHVASDRQLDDDLFGNIAAHMWACRYGVALFEDRADRGLNENMMIEVGSMLITGRRCALLRDTSVERMPTDFVGHIYKPVNFEDLDGVHDALHTWAATDLGLGACTTCSAAAV